MIKPFSKTSEYVKQWNKDHPEEYAASKAKRRRLLRESYIGVIVNGKLIFKRAPGKRPYPETQKCELCGKGPRQLGYHHWDDTDFSKGLWLCRPCHTNAGKVENGWVEKYLELKRKVEGGEL